MNKSGEDNAAIKLLDTCKHDFSGLLMKESLTLTEYFGNQTREKIRYDFVSRRTQSKRLRIAVIGERGIGLVAIHII